MPAHFSKEARIYLALWRKALEGKEVNIKVSSLHMGISIRQGMYRAIRPFRNRELGDKELETAADKFVVYFDQEKLEIQLRERQVLEALLPTLDELDISEMDLLFGEERQVAAKLDELINKPKKRKTKFFERE